jgi:hypothetical protein
MTLSSSFFTPNARAAWVLAFAASLALHPALAAESDWSDTIRDLHPYAAISFTYDSNLLRSSSDLDPKSDRYLQLEAGLDTELNVNRQRFLINGKIVNVAYDRFSRYDYTGGDAALIWKWVLGRLWDGDLAYTYDRRLRAFGDQLLPIKDLRDTNRLYGSANRWLTDHWKAGALLDWTNVSFSETKFLDITRNGVGAHLTYYTELDNSIGLLVNYTDAQYTNRVDRDYVDFSTGPAAEWKITDKTLLKANIFYKSRTYDVLSEQDFSGPVGRLTALWKASGKTAVKASVYHDISDLDDDIATYAVIDGVSVQPTWAITGKTSLRALANFERRNFQGRRADAADLGLSERVDEVTELGLWLDWQARRNVLLSLGYGVDDRNSDRQLRDYNAEYVEARFQIGL